MQLFENLSKSFVQNKNNNAFFIDEVYYSYETFATLISKIRIAIQKTTQPDEYNIGLIINDDLETYASIMALWFEGKAYVPIITNNPKDRNDKVVKQAEIKTILDSSDSKLFSTQQIITTNSLPEAGLNVNAKTTSGDNLAYIFFTSGTTGEPKGVPITRNNVSGFIDAFNKMNLKIDHNDRFLQMFDLTFDLSVMSYLVPLIYGACVYPIPKGKIKYNYIFELIDEHDLTIALMVPSILHYLRPYFDEIDAPGMKYSLFCGEALPLDVTKEWSKCLPNAEISNVYGPTENTIFCTRYKYNRDKKNKEHNGVLCIGKSMVGVETIIIDQDNKKLPQGVKGELCLAGKLLTPGYWKNEEKNAETFFTQNYNGKPTRFYKTGDLCVEDTEGDILYLGRIDFQTQIQGFRVELSEVEFHVKAYLNKVNAVAIAFTNKIGNTEIGLVIESNDIYIQGLNDYLKEKMPSYMIPTQTKFVKTFPLNANGKTDRKILKQLF